MSHGDTVINGDGIEFCGKATFFSNDLFKVLADFMEVYVSGEERHEGTYTVIVADNGPGISEDDRERIFEHFEQLSKGDARLVQGVGLGLPIARKLARAMGGDLWYEARFPVGAAFCFDVEMVREGDRASAPVAAEVGAGR